MFFRQPWEDNGNTSNCVINMSNLSTVDDTFENILQVNYEHLLMIIYNQHQYNVNFLLKYIGNF